jgi:hypothetical protein
MLLHMFVMFMIEIVPTVSAKHLNVLRMWIADGVAVQIRTCIGRLTGLLLGAGEMAELLILPNEGRQVRKDRDFGVAVSVMRDGCAIDEYDVAVIDPELLVEHAADNSVTGTQPLYPYRLF